MPKENIELHTYKICIRSNNLGHPFKKYLYPFEWLGSSVQKNIYPFERLGSSVPKNLYPFKRLESSFQKKSLSVRTAWVIIHVNGLMPHGSHGNYNNNLFHFVCSEMPIVFCSSCSFCYFPGHLPYFSLLFFLQWWFTSHILLFLQPNLLRSLFLKG